MTSKSLIYSCAAALKERTLDPFTGFTLSTIINPVKSEIRKNHHFSWGLTSEEVFSSVSPFGFFFVGSPDFYTVPRNPKWEMSFRNIPLVVQMFKIIHFAE